MKRVFEQGAFTMNNRNLPKSGKIYAVIFAMSLVALLVLSGIASATLTIKANHDHIKIDFFYHGSTVSVRGESEPGTDLVVKIASPEGHQTLKRKGKTGDFLWMNVGELNFNHVPQLYFIHSTSKLEDLLSTEEMDKYVIGYSALERHVEIDPLENETEKTTWFDELIKFKEASRLYSRSSGNITTTTKDGKQDYYILLDWPYQAQPGDYTVTVYEIKDGKVIDHVDTTVLVEQVSVVKALADMAKNKGALYGVLSIVAALGAGFGVGMIFRKGGGAH